VGESELQAIRRVVSDQWSADQGPPGYERRPQYRTMLICGVLGLLLATSGLIIGCAVDTDQSTQIPSIPGLPTLPAFPGGRLPTAFPTGLPTGFPTDLPPLPTFGTGG
jgi:hypothetical protein